MIRLFFKQILLGASLCLFACQGKTDTDHGAAKPYSASNPVTEMSAENYVAFVKSGNSELQLSKEISGFIYSVRFVPAEYLALRELGKESLNAIDLDKKAGELSELQYFNFTIQHKTFRQELLKYDLSSPQEYTSRLEYLSFLMQKDLRLIEGNDTLACELFHFERSYDLAPYLTFTMAFKNTKRKGDKTFSFNDQVFKNGEINITFYKAAFENIPKLKTS